MSIEEKLLRQVIRAGICTGCGACVAADPSGLGRMEDTPFGPRPAFAPSQPSLPDLAWNACPGKGVNYPDLYRKHYGALPGNWLLGCFQKVRTGYSANPEIRSGGASGGVISHTLVHLLEKKLIDAAIVVQQGIPEPRKARVKIARSRSEVLAAAQSVYVPVSVLDILPTLIPGERYAMTCLPDQAVALRILQQAGHEKARQIRYVLGPYTGTALYPAAIDCYLRSKKVRRDDAVTSLKWRAGEWPGYMEIKTASGRVLQSKKVYYNFLIPFFITQSSLQAMDFTNEFCDLSVGDAWSPRFEGQARISRAAAGNAPLQGPCSTRTAGANGAATFPTPCDTASDDVGGGHSVFTTRSPEMERIVQEMEAAGMLVTEAADPMQTLEMHGHMLDFKKRGGYIRNRMRRLVGKAAPDYGMRPQPLPFSRVAVELVISSLFLVGATWPARKLIEHIPESVLGPAFDWLRLKWKALSKPTKRKGLGQLTMVVQPPK